MNQLVRMYVRHCLIGFALALAFTGGILWLNIGNLWHLVTHTSGGIIAVVMLIVFNTIVFAGVQFAVAVMRMAEPEAKTPRGPRAPVTHTTPAHVTVAAPAAKAPRRFRADR